MKLRKYIFAAALILAAMLPQAATAQGTVIPKIYMFGFAASFNDTIVHFTEIQAVDSAWVNSKTKFLMARNSYSYMLSDYLTKHQMPYRTCVVFYDKKLNKLQKKYLKMKKLYEGNKKSKNRNDIRIIPASDFKFTALNLAPPVEEIEE